MEKAKAKVRWRENWKNTAIDLTKNQAGLSIDKLRQIEFEELRTDRTEKLDRIRAVNLRKITEERDQDQNQRAVDFSRKQSDRVKALNNESAFSADLKKNAAEWYALKQHRTVELELKKKLTDLEVDLREAENRAGNWSTLRGANKSKKSSDKPVRVRLERGTEIKPVKVDATKNVRRTWRANVTEPKDGTTKEQKAQWNVDLSLPKGQNTDLHPKRRDLTIERLHAEQQHLTEEVDRANLRLKERSFMLQREVDTRLDVKRQEQLNQRAVQLELDMTALRNISEKNTLKARAARPKLEKKIFSATRKMVHGEEAKVGTAKKGRSGVR
ncbi:MAG: hypothetical protein ACI91B_002672 [Planctomycetota bacterium]|jgi:hypothetical protein